MPGTECLMSGLPEQPWPSVLTAPCRKLRQKLTPHSQTWCLRAPWGEIPGEDHTFRGASYHREGHLDGTLVQSSVTGTCKAEAGLHVRTSVWQQAVWEAVL